MGCRHYRTHLKEHLACIFVVLFVVQVGVAIKVGREFLFVHVNPSLLLSLSSHLTSIDLRFFYSVASSIDWFCEKCSHALQTVNSQGDQRCRRRIAGLRVFPHTLSKVACTKRNVLSSPFQYAAPHRRLPEIFVAKLGALDLPQCDGSGIAEAS